MGYVQLGSLFPMTGTSSIFNIIKKPVIPTSVKTKTITEAIITKQPTVQPAIQPILQPIIQPTIKPVVTPALPLPSQSKPDQLILSPIVAPTSVLRPATPVTPTARPASPVIIPVKPVVPATVNKELLDNVADNAPASSIFSFGSSSGFGLNRWSQRSRLSNPDQKIPTTKSGMSITAVEPTIITGTETTTGLTIQDPPPIANIIPTTTGVTFASETRSGEGQAAQEPATGYNNMLLIAAVVAGFIFLPKLLGK